MSKGIAMCDVKTREVIEVFTSVLEASDFIECHHKTIRFALKRRLPIAKGYYWKEIEPHKYCNRCAEAVPLSNYTIMGFKYQRPRPYCKACE